MPARPFRQRCRHCNQPVNWPPPSPRCPRPSCRGPLQPRKNIVFDATAIEPAQLGMWRYRNMLPTLPPQPVVLGEGGTPLLTAQAKGFHLHFKSEMLNPTGSFKDRGAALLINSIGETNTVIDDSSGNAGAALAAYAARAGVTARIFAPTAAPQSKLDQITRFGAELTLVDGNRDAVAAAVEEAAASDDVFYASHVWHPGYAIAMQTVAWEIWEQLGRRGPDWVIMPAGNGSLLRGVRWGFRALQKGKYIADLPRLVAVQAANCAPLYAFSRDAYLPHEFRAQPTVADGVAIPTPPLIKAMWAAVRKTKGRVITVSEDEILPARAVLARRGLFVEPTASLGYAALRQLQDNIKPDHTVVVILTGHGFKTG